MPAPGHQVVLLLLTARLASSRLLAAGRNRAQHGPARERRVEPVSRFPGLPAHRAADELRPCWRYLVRWHVGQAGRQLATAADVRLDSSAAAGHADRAKSPSGTSSR